MRTVIDEVEQQQQYWEDLVARIAAGAAGSGEEFRSTYGPGIRFLMQRRIGEQHLEEVVEQTMAEIVAAIAGHRLSTVAEMARYIRRAMPADHRPGPKGPGGPVVTDQERAQAQARVQTLEEVLERFSAPEREALVSFYARGFSEQDVEAEFGYDRVQFRLLRERMVRALNSARAQRRPMKTARPLMLRAQAASGAA